MSRLMTMGPIYTALESGNISASGAVHPMAGNRVEQGVLIVEDHPDTALMLKRYLLRRGVGAEVAGSGEQALDILAQHKPRCMILDESMPGMSGLQLLGRLREDPEYAEIPVYFYSAAFEQKKQAQAEELGAKGWFIKGISRLDDLMGLVIDVCRG